MTDSPPTLYQLSLEKVVYRLNCLCHYFKEGRKSLLLEHSSSTSCPAAPLDPSSHYVLKYCCGPHHRDHHRFDLHSHGGHSHHHPHHHGPHLRSFHHYTSQDEDADADDDDHIEPSIKDGSSTPSNGQRGFGEEFNATKLHSSHGYDDKLKKMKKSYHNFVNTFIFGGSGGGGGSSKKPPTIPGYPGSSSSSSGSSSESESEHERLRNSYRITPSICEDILAMFQKKYPITDRVLKLAIFQGSINRLRALRVDEAGELSTLGLQMLGQHRIRSLQISHLNKCNVNELINCLSDWSRKNLETLSVRFCSFSKQNRVCIVLSFASLTNLTALDVSYTDFNNHGLEIISEDLPRLRSLNISSTKVNILAPLQKTSHRLTHLCAHNTSASCRDEHILTSLTLLQKLDISDSRSYLDQSQNNLGEFISSFAAFAALVELDLSGRNSVGYSEIEQLIVAKQRGEAVAPLRFLGLLETNLNYDELLDLMRISKEPIVLTGNGNLSHIIESLRRYKDCAAFVQKSLLHLYSTRFQLESQEMLDNRSEIITLIIDLLHAYLANVNIVLVSTACLYIFTQMIFSSTHPPLHAHVLTKVVQINMLTMDKYSTNQPVMKNILLTLCSDRILQEINFDRMHCMQLVMDSLITFNEPTLNRLALAVCSILAAKIPTEQTTLIGQQLKYMNRLLEFAQRKNVTLDAENRDVLFKLALSALWNFTDESPKTCQVFIENKGLQIYIEALIIYHGQNSVETKILGLINNIAEVAYLRHYLVNYSLLFNLKKLIQSEHIDISYFSAGILAQLGSDPNLDWSQLEEQFQLHEVLNEMKQVILSWQTPNFEMVAYRSFLPFVALLTCTEHSAVQLWALWAIHHVCTKSGSQKYCQMLHDEHCLTLIVTILDDRLRTHYKLTSPAHRRFLRTRLIAAVTPQCYDSKFEENGSSPTGSSHSTSNSPGHPFHSTKPQCSFLFSKCITIPNDITELLGDEAADEEALAAAKYSADSNQFSVLTCDCKLRHYLARDPFLCLPALILQTFERHCPRLVKKDFEF